MSAAQLIDLMTRCHPAAIPRPSRREDELLLRRLIDEGWNRT